MTLRAGKRFRADLSGPILAILITVAAIAAGALVAMWFLRAGNQVSKASMLMVSGQPTIIPGSTSTAAYVTLKNIGNEPVKVNALVINDGGSEVKLTPTNLITTIEPGQSMTVEFTGSGITLTNDTIPAVIVTDKGTLPVVLYVVSSASTTTTTTSTIIS